MIGFSILLGHLVGDYIFQNDWQARLKVAQKPTEPRPPDDAGMPSLTTIVSQHRWDSQASDARRAPWACAIHCWCYTLAMLFCTWPVHLFPWWFYVAVGVIHWPIDRWRLAGRWMRNVSNQAVFASPPPVGMAPWSVIIVDNTFHLLTAFVLALLAGV